MAKISKIHFFFEEPLGYNSGGLSKLEFVLGDTVLSPTDITSISRTQATFKLSGVLATMVASSTYPADSYSVFHALKGQELPEGYGWMANSGAYSSATSTVTITFEAPISIDNFSFSGSNRSGNSIGANKITVTLNDNSRTAQVFTNTRDWNNPQTYYISLTRFFLKYNNKLYDPDEVTDISQSDGIDVYTVNKQLINDLFPAGSLVYLVQYDGDNNPVTEPFSIGLTFKDDNVNYIAGAGDIDVLTVEEIQSVSIDYTGTATIRMLVSNDSGITWKTYNNGWNNVNLNNIQTDGMNITSVPTEAWSELLPANKLRFAYSIIQETPSDNAVINSISLTYKYEGVYSSAILGTDATYSKGTDFAEITFKRAGNYLVNATEA